ncbi:MAG TPA: TlpA disulfide reductase family protein [Bacteroidia bacterium]
MISFNGFTKGVCLILCFLVGSLIAQNSEDVIKKVLKTQKSFNNYDAEFESWFKFASSDDTGYSKYKYSLYTILNVPVSGRFIADKWNTRFYNALASNVYCSFSTKDSIYYDYTFKEHKAYFVEYAKENIYEPFAYKSKYLKQFKLLSDTGNCYTLLLDENYQDEIGNTKRHKALLSVDKQSWLIVAAEEWFWMEGKVQYSKIKMIHFALMPERKLKQFTQECDSLIKVYRSYKSGDSIRAIFDSKYAKLSVGDKAPELKGLIHNTNDSFDVHKHQDSILILDFSYTTCAYCYLSIPALKAINARYKGQGVSLYSINQFKNDWPKIDDYEAYHKIDFSSVQVKYDYGYTWGVRGHPTFVIVKNGVVCFILNGYDKNLEDILSKEIEKLR